jgi:predicted RNA-binding Zn ribbon-like protein
MVMDAPGDLALVQRLVNTADLETGSDDLGDTDALAAWLATAGLASPEERFDEAGRKRIVELREALRALLLANHGERPDRHAVAALDRAAYLVVTFDAGGRARLAPAGDGVDRVLGTVLAIVAHAQADGSWQRLKACPGERCGWAFYDGSRNRSRTWCAMSVCGNRSKARSYRARQR